MPGGALATFKYVSSITKNSSLISIINKDLYNKYKNKFKLDNNIISSQSLPRLLRQDL